MSRIAWDQDGQRRYEAGVDRGVLYKKSGSAYGAGVPWNGLTAVGEKPSGAEANPIYANNIEYLNLVGREKFAATIEAYTFPDEFAECDGSAEITPGLFATQQSRKKFGLCYRSKIGNDVSEDLGYKLHLVYNGLAAPSEKAHNTINENPEAVTMSWEVSTTPVEVTGYNPTAHLIIDSTKTDATKMAALEDILYGTANAAPRLPLPDEVKTLLTENAPSALALSSISPADDATNVAVDATIVLTFNNKIARENVVVAEDDGTIVEVARSWDAAHKVLTLTPSTDFETTEGYLVMIGGVVDIYGQSLADAVKNFTVVDA